MLPFHSSHGRMLPQMELLTEPHEDAIQRRFLAFHRDNPQVYTRLVALARQAKRAGRLRYGIRRLWEVMRWEFSLQTTSDDDFKLNDHYHARYARLIMQQEPDLK